MTFHIITIFPEIFDSYFSESIIKRAQKNNAIKIKIYNLRDWAIDKHKTIDDMPYGGGAGMVMKADVLYRALRDIESRIMNNESCKKINKLNSKFIISSNSADRQNSKKILFSAKGKKWNQKIAKEYCGLDHIIMICGRYEGVDERILNFVDEEISIGNYVLTGGEIPAMAIIDSITRLLPGVLGNEVSADDESHAQPGILEYAQYTRPEVFIDNDGIEHKVPEILLSGDHEKIKKWRESKKTIQAKEE